MQQHCLIYPVSVSGGQFQWKWRLKDGKRKSERAFEWFYECVEDARNNGCDVDLEHIHQEISAVDTSLKIVPQAKRA